MFLDDGSQQVETRIKLEACLLLIKFGKPTVAGDIGVKNGGEASFHCQSPIGRRLRLTRQFHAVYPSLAGCHVKWLDWSSIAKVGACGAPPLEVRLIYRGRGVKIPMRVVDCDASTGLVSQLIDEICSYTSRAKLDSGGITMSSKLILVPCATIISICALVASTLSLGQTTKIVVDAILSCPKDEEPCFREGFGDTLNVSSGVVVGLSLGGGSGLASIEEVLIDKSGFPKASAFCLKETSVDGLFWAENSYREAQASEIWRVAPISEQFLDQLEPYGEDEVLATATIALSPLEDLCSAADLIYAPVVNLSENEPKQLTAFINSSHRFTEAGLWELGAADDDPPIAEATCENANLDAAGVYDQVCVIDLEKVSVSGVRELRLFFDAPPFGMEPWTERVALPTRTPTAAGQ